jgi:AraC-like DNA-binding protein
LKLLILNNGGLNRFDNSAANELLALKAFETIRSHKPEVGWFENSVNSRKMDPRVQQVVLFIRSNYHRKLTLAEMAGTVNLSRFRLSHLFKIDTETSPERFLTQVRLDKARQLLETEFLTVKEVMNQVGMSDASNFTRAFKAAYGVTPTKCRAASKKR